VWTRADGGRAGLYIDGRELPLFLRTPSTAHPLTESSSESHLNRIASESTPSDGWESTSRVKEVVRVTRRRDSERTSEQHTKRACG